MTSQDRVADAIVIGGGIIHDRGSAPVERHCRAYELGAEALWASAPLTKGKWWENTAVPDIRGQVADIAKQIAEEVKE
jgi:uncharacterized NAD(P)/FAD-binding protein YdhS